jgi:N-acetyl sugar amidotransferase
MPAMYGLPEVVQFCKLCVISNQRPSSAVEFTHRLSDKKKTIGFDEDGICDACRFNIQKQTLIDWNQRESDLEKLLEKHRSKKGYNVVVPGSGGKDSAFTSHILKYKYGMNPLTVTWAPHLYTQVGWENFQNWIHVGGLDNLLFTPNGKLHRFLTRQAFLNLLHPFQPFIVGQRLIGPLIAQKFGIDLVMYGENQAEYGNSIDENKDPKMDKGFFTTEDPTSVVLGGLPIKEIINQTDFSINDFTPYLPIDAETKSNKALEVHYLGYYLKWDPQECYYYAVENTGFNSNDQRTEGSYSKYSSIDDKIDPFHYFTTLIKFGLGRASYDAAQEIRNQNITRDEGVELVNKLDTEFPNRYFKEFLDYISISEVEFFSTIDKFRPEHLWENRNGVWILRNRVTSLRS